MALRADGSRLAARRVVVRAAQAAAQLLRQLLVAAAARGPLVVLVELAARAQRRVAHGAREVVHAPRLVQRREHISGDDLVAYVAQIAEQLVVVLLAVREALLLVVPVPVERLLAFSAHEMLNVPMFPEGGDDSLLDGTATGAADRDAHLVVAPKAKQVVHVVGRVARAVLDLARRVVELDPARGAREVVPVPHLAAVTQRLAVDHTMALVAHVVLQAVGLDACVAGVAQRAARVLDEAGVRQLRAALRAAEAGWVPVGVHRLDHSSDDELAAFAAAWSEKHLKVLFAVFTALKFVKHSIREHPETLGTYKTVCMPEFSVGVDNLLIGLKPIAAASAVHILQ